MRMIKQNHQKKQIMTETVLLLILRSKHKENPQVMKGKRYEIEDHDDRKRYVEVLRRAGKAKSKKRSNSYNIKDIETGENSWTRNLCESQCRHLRKLEEDEEVYPCNFHDEEILEAKMKKNYRAGKKKSYTSP